MTTNGPFVSVILATMERLAEEGDVDLAAPERVTDAVIEALSAAGYRIVRIGPSVIVPLEVVEDIVAWWRGPNEAPGGCSYKEAIGGMKDAVHRLEDARREQGS